MCIEKEKEEHEQEKGRTMPKKKKKGERSEECNKLVKQKACRAERCRVPTFLHKNKSSFDLGIHPWAKKDREGMK